MRDMHAVIARDAGAILQRAEHKVSVVDSHRFDVASDRAELREHDIALERFDMRLPEDLRHQREHRAGAIDKPLRAVLIIVLPARFVRRRPTDAELGVRAHELHAIVNTPLERVLGESLGQSVERRLKRQTLVGYRGKNGSLPPVGPRPNCTVCAFTQWIEVSGI